ncbi:uncharacterized protein YjiS (DUF1127 family) [Azospirillum agricola]|uniref:DUF1127 domain-containing protein n=1 Tax=Azospirillum agricola TaxID=1720247 RepID=UPI001AE679FB|nr:DUF1127 domain-containing protein [Azospirillum agricola]MBP2231401.1 uncharacterized protein YjiS (DUF1127 family) [Azospirillum agricola]
MSYSSLPSSHGELFGAETNRSSLFQRVVHWVKERADLYRAEYELNHMSDMELADVGLTRGDIHNAVRHGRIA